MLTMTEMERPVTHVTSRRPLRKRVVHWLRRGHLYFGLFLFPWAILYGVTAFLFNHPTVFSDNPSTTFSADVTRGTAVETWPAPNELAEAVVARLNEQQKPATPYRKAGEARFNRENAFATVKVEKQTINVLLNVTAGTGTVRSTAEREKPKVEKAPFALGRASESRGRGRTSEPAISSKDGLHLDTKLGEQFKTAVPTILERSGFLAGEVTVTSVPEVVVPIEAEGRIWKATWNPLTGSLGGTLADSEQPRELSTRRFLLSLHVAHGYPDEATARWWWAVIVDAMAFTMCFWGLTGLIMWWQIKATRKPGLVILALSAVTATTLALMMHEALTLP